MFILESYSLAVIFCIITMLAWGSWANTQKLTSTTWRFELYYWDYVLGIVLFALIFALTAGSLGTEGRPFLEDLEQGSWENMGSAFIGGVLFNVANILLVASITMLLSAMPLFSLQGLGLLCLLYY